MNKGIRASMVSAGLVLLALLLHTSASLPAGINGDFDISLRELGKVKREHPRKKKPADRGKRIRSETAARKPDLTQAPPADLQTEAIRISHEPYSYVVAGKQTVILAVISSANDVKAAYCRFRGEEQSQESVVTMTKVEGTSYTYRAILPGLAPEARSLRYRLVAVDTQGKETQSREFSTVVRTSTVLPGWQLEDSPDAPKDEHPVTEKASENPPATVQSR